MDQYLIPINNVQDAPKDAYVIYNIQGGIFYVKFTNWNKFCAFFTHTKHQESFLTMDLCLAIHHSLIFDIDIKYIDPNEEQIRIHLFSYLERIITVVLKPLFLSEIKHFTCVVTFRENGGIHMHFPEMHIAHDDYILLCQSLQPQFECKNEYFTCQLDILKNAFLTNCGKPRVATYIPYYVFFVGESHSYTISFKDATSFARVKSTFKRQRDTMHSFFRKLLLLTNISDVMQIARELMMPVVAVYSPIYKLLYNTWINNDKTSNTNERIVCHFTYRQQECLYIHKHNELRFHGGPSWLQTYNYLTHSVVLISDMTTTNYALKRWFEEYRSKTPIEKDVFHHINTLLRQDNLDFSEDPNPLRTILNFNNGYYFLPIFYSLIQCLGISSRKLIQHLRTIIYNSDLLNRLEQIDNNLLEYTAKDFSIKTILYCGSNLNAKPKSLKDKMALIIHNLKNLLLCVRTEEEIITHIKRIQERHFPMVVINMLNTSRKPTRYMWNFMNECWQELTKETEVTHLINTIWSCILMLLKTNDRMGDMKTVNVNLVVSSIMTETNVEQKHIDMDRHKWHLRVKEGIFDLMSGYLSGTVPEYYISNRCMGVHFQDISELRTRVDLIHTYQLLIDKQFFLKYLKALFTDLTDDLYDTLREVFSEHGGQLNPLTESMLQFYSHFCKYTSFEYDIMMYLLDIISSLLIATNYARKFLVFKGNTRNGKSKFFQMLSRVFGGYSYTVRSINLQAGNTGLQAQPELASSIFNCRVVTVEELSGKLNENMIKELTGNSVVSFRKMYEQGQGGIPTAKIFASTNSLPSCTATEAFKDRVVAIPFEAIFSHDAPETTSDQVEKGIYKLETNDSVIELSYQGFFALIYQHFLHTVNLEEGTIEYRKEPDYLLEYKEEFLVMTDIFNQFKQFMDVQVIPGCITSLQDVKSAIRQFLKQTRNTSYDESELFIRFDMEYREHKNIETDLNSFFPLPDDDYDYLDNEEEEPNSEFLEPPSKKNKMEEKIVIYRNIQIKNLRKERR